jgi:putative SbcD/Mre11-related phosphoesterase
VVADLHLGYCETRRRGGDAVPTFLLSEILSPLRKVLRRYGLHRLVIAGDLFERGIDDVLLNELRNWLRSMNIQLVGIVPGNHDRLQGQGRADLMIAPDGIALGEWLVVHGDRPMTRRPTICGHFHPGVDLAGRRWPCYLVTPNRIVLPAYSLDARGGHDKAWPGYRRLVPAGAEVLDFGPVLPHQSRKPARGRRRLRG